MRVSSVVCQLTTTFSSVKKKFFKSPFSFLVFSGYHETNLLIELEWKRLPAVRIVSVQ